MFGAKYLLWKWKPVLLFLLMGRNSRFLSQVKTFFVRTKSYLCTLALVRLRWRVDNASMLRFIYIAIFVSPSKWCRQHLIMPPHWWKSPLVSYPPSKNIFSRRSWSHKLCRNPFNYSTRQKERMLPPRRKEEAGDVYMWDPLRWCYFLRYKCLYTSFFFFFFSMVEAPFIRLRPPQDIGGMGPLGSLRNSLIDFYLKCSTSLPLGCLFIFYEIDFFFPDRIYPLNPTETIL